MAEPRTSSVTIGIKRLYNTAQFENIEIKLETTENIQWESLADRANKISKITSLLDAQFTKTQTQVFDDLGVEEKRAWRKQPASKPQSRLGDAL